MVERVVVWSCHTPRQLYRDLKGQGFALLTVTQDAAPDVLKMVEYNGITHPIVSDTKDAATGNVYGKYHAYDGKHYLIGSDGRILAAFSKLGVSIPILARELAKYGIRAPAASPTTPAQAPAATPARPEARRPVAWAGVVTPTAASAGGKLVVTLSVAVEPGWHIYATTQRSGGPTPLAITVPAGQPFAMAGPIKPPAPEVKFDPNFGIEVSLVSARGEFVLPVAVAATAAAGKRTLTIEARYQACNDRLCLPAETERVQMPVTVTPRK